MGDVDLLTNSLQAALRGEPVDPKPLLRFVRATKGDPANKRKMAAAALLSIAEHRDEAYDVLDWMLANEEASGPRTWELLCPDPHAGMYGLAEVAIVTFATCRPTSRLADRQLALTGQRLALYDLIATPDGDVTGLPGVRSNSPKGPARMAETFEYREWYGVSHRWGKSKERRLESWKPTSDDQAIFTASAWWWRQLKRRTDACLPPALPLALVVYRWATGTLAYFERPANIKEWLTYGSAASKKDPDRTEDACSSVRVDWKKPGKHEVKAILSWREEAPVGDVPAGAVRTRIPAVGEKETSCVV